MSSSGYDIGLDIGTSSVGFAGTDDHLHLVRAKGKNIFGVRLFDEGKTAAERRGFRGTRRRYKRRKYRLRFLRKIFEPYILEKDPTFFQRLAESNLSSQDEQKHYRGSLLFPDRKDKNFYQEFLSRVSDDVPFALSSHERLAAIRCSRGLFSLTPYC